jgi:hypothetical protein
VGLVGLLGLVPSPILHIVLVAQRAYVMQTYRHLNSETIVIFLHLGDEKRRMKRVVLGLNRGSCQQARAVHLSGSRGMQFVLPHCRSGYLRPNLQESDVRADVE